MSLIVVTSRSDIMKFSSVTSHFNGRDKQTLLEMMPYTYLCLEREELSYVCHSALYIVLLHFSYAQYLYCLKQRGQKWLLSGKHFQPGHSVHIIVFVN